MNAITMVPLGVAITLAVSAALADERVSDGSGRLRLASCQFPVSADVAANGEWVRKQMGEAHELKADLVHFCECALSGYPGTDFNSLEGFDWELLKAETAKVLELAKELKLWVVLGSMHRLSGEHNPHNSLYVISPQGEIVDRYDKRFCTGGDLKYFSPGDHFVTFEVNGVKIGLLICYDVRFPELHREYCKLGVQLLLHSFHNARQKEGAIHPLIMPITAQALAGINYMFTSITNSSAPRSWPCHLITPDGRVATKLTVDEPGVLVNEIDTQRQYYDAARPYRLDAINGKLNSGTVVDDPRSRDRKSY